MNWYKRYVASNVFMRYKLSDAITRYWVMPDGRLEGEPGAYHSEVAKKLGFPGDAQPEFDRHEAPLAAGLVRVKMPIGGPDKMLFMQSSKPFTPGQRTTLQKLIWDTYKKMYPDAGFIIWRGEEALVRTNDPKEAIRGLTL